MEPDPSRTWVLPRAFSTDVCPVNYRRDISVVSSGGVLIDCTPDLDKCIKITQKAETPVLATINGSVQFNLGLESLAGVWYHPLLTWRSAVSNEVYDLPYFLAPAPGEVALANGKLHLDTRILYLGDPAAWGDQQISPVRTGGVTTNLTQRVQTFDVALNQTGIDTQNTAAAVSGAIVSNAVGIAPGTGKCFALSWQTTNFVLYTQVSFGLTDTNLVLDSYVTSSYDPAPNLGESLYRTVVESSSKYSFPAMSVLATFTGSDLLNGGNIAIGVVPHDFSLSVIPQAAYDQISSLGSHVYVGPMKNGAHGFYVPDDLTRIAFLEMNEKVKGRRICIAIIPQSALGAAQGSNVSMRLEVRSHIEFINASQTLSHMSSKAGAEELLEALYSALQVKGCQVGENPSHVKRMFDTAKAVARDPKTKAIATDVLKFAGKSALKLAPLLLAAL
jgi:hypothetical protein